MKGNKGDFSMDETGKWVLAIIILAILIIIMITLARRGNWALGNLGNLFRFGR